MWNVEEQTWNYIPVSAGQNTQNKILTIYVKHQQESWQTNILFESNLKYFVCCHNII